MQLVQVDALQHDVIITDRDDDVAVILPNLNMSVVQLAGILEVQLIDPELEVGDRRVDAALPDDKSVRTITTGHSHVAARCHQRVIQISAGQDILARGSDHKLRHTVGSLLSGRVYSSQGAAVPLGGDESITLHRCGISVAQDQVRQRGALDLA